MGDTETVSLQVPEASFSPCWNTTEAGERRPRRPQARAGDQCARADAASNQLHERLHWLVVAPAHFPCATATCGTGIVTSRVRARAQNPDARRSLSPRTGERGPLLNLCFVPAPIRPCRSPRWPGLHCLVISRARTGWDLWNRSCDEQGASDYKIVTAGKAFPKDG